MFRIYIHTPKCLKAILLGKYLSYDICTNLILFPLVLVLYVCALNIATNVSNRISLHLKTRNKNGYETSEWPFEAHKSNIHQMAQWNILYLLIDIWRKKSPNTLITQNYVFVVCWVKPFKIWHLFNIVFWYFLLYLNF